MNDAVDAVLACWRSAGVPLQAGVARQSVVAALVAIGRQVSSDVARLYERANGMMEGELDARLFAFWPLKQVIRDARRVDARLIPFADFLVSSHEYVFHHETPHRSSVWVIGRSSDATPEPVADSVDEFFSMLMHDPEKVHVHAIPDAPTRRDFWPLRRR